MTREEAFKEYREIDKNHKWYNYDLKLSGLMVKIYDDLESRTCENCKHWQGNIETPSKGICSQLGVHNIGGCGDYFERKDK